MTTLTDLHLYIKTSIMYMQLLSISQIEWTIQAVNHTHQLDYSWVLWDSYQQKKTGFDERFKLNILYMLYL